MQTHSVEKGPKSVEEPSPSGLIPLTRFAKDIGRTTGTLLRWRNAGWLKTINVAGKCYISTEEIERFNTRAAAGEFSKHATR